MPMEVRKACSVRAANSRRNGGSGGTDHIRRALGLFRKVGLAGEGTRLLHYASITARKKRVKKRLCGGIFPQVLCRSDLTTVRRKPTIARARAVFLPAPTFLTVSSLTTPEHSACSLQRDLTSFRHELDRCWR